MNQSRQRQILVIFSNFYYTSYGILQFVSQTTLQMPQQAQIQTSL